MLIPVFVAASQPVSPLARVLEQANMFPRAVTEAAEFFQQFSQQSFT